MAVDSIPLRDGSTLLDSLRLTSGRAGPLRLSPGTDHVLLVALRKGLVEVPRLERIFEVALTWRLFVRLDQLLLVEVSKIYVLSLQVFHLRVQVHDYKLHVAALAFFLPAKERVLGRYVVGTSIFTHPKKVVLRTPLTSEIFACRVKVFQGGNTRVAVALRLPNGAATLISRDGPLLRLLVVSGLGLLALAK